MQLTSPPIAIGFTAEIYAWHAGQVLKLFNPGFSRRTVEYEADLSRKVHATGLPVPAVGEIIELDGRYGLELERVDGISMLQAVTQRPWKLSYYAHLLAELQADMHTRRVPGLPPLKDRLDHKIRAAAKLPENVRQAALQRLVDLPEDGTLCHGDFHPGNILLTAHGPVIIDWIDAALGKSILDVARSSLLFGSGNIPSSFPGARILRLVQGSFYRTYICKYFQLNPAGHEQLEYWIPVAAAGRLDENIFFDEARLLSIAQTLVQPG